MVCELWVSPAKLSGTKNKLMNMNKGMPSTIVLGKYRASAKPAHNLAKKASCVWGIFQIFLVLMLV